MDLEDLQMRADDTNKGVEDDDDVEGWVDEVALLSPKERTKLACSIRPIRIALIKVIR